MQLTKQAAKSMEKIDLFIDRNIEYHINYHTKQSYENNFNLSW
jgi:hypothetical protein